MNLYYTDRSKEDIDLAIMWYELQRKGLGFDFLDCVDVALRNILRFPKMYAISYANYRRCVISRFPFSIIYTIEGEEIIIHSVFDNRQDPKKRP